MYTNKLKLSKKAMSNILIGISIFVFALVVGFAIFKATGGTISGLIEQAGNSLANIFSFKD